MATQKTRVSLQSKLTAVSSRPIEWGKTQLFTSLDLAMGLHSLHIIFYYKAKPFGSFDLDPLRVSFSEVLSLYPPVTGRLVRGEKGNWEVKCNDAGVRVVKAKVGVSLDEWLRSADGCDERDLTVWDDMPQDPNLWSPFQVQLNEFEGGGAAIGLSCSHMHVDPYCATLILKAWAEVHRHEPIEHPPHFNQGQPQISNTKWVNNHYHYSSKSKANTPSLKMGTATFKFSASMIKQSLLEMNEKCPNATPFDFLTGLFWTCISSFNAPSHTHTHSLSICIDTRELAHPPLPKGYFGNALHFSLLSLDEKENLVDVVKHVHSHVSGLKEKEFRSGIENQAPFRIYGPELTFVSMEHMILPSAPTESNHYSFPYAVTFEKNIKPVHVTYQVGNFEGDGLIMVMPSPEEGLARTVTVTLPEEETAKLCQVEAILRLEPMMLLSGIHSTNSSLIT